MGQATGLLISSTVGKCDLKCLFIYLKKAIFFGFTDGNRNGNVIKKIQGRWISSGCVGDLA